MPQRIRPKASKATTTSSQAASPRSMVVLDSPDDGELFDTGDASDHAGKTSHGTTKKSSLTEPTLRMAHVRRYKPTRTSR